jgi:hypothetical protein
MSAWSATRTYRRDTGSCAACRAGLGFVESLLTERDGCLAGWSGVSAGHPWLAACRRCWLGCWLTVSSQPESPGYRWRPGSMPPPSPPTATTRHQRCPRAAPTERRRTAPAPPGAGQPPLGRLAGWALGGASAALAEHHQAHPGGPGQPVGIGQSRPAPRGRPGAPTRPWPARSQPPRQRPGRLLGRPARSSGRGARPPHSWADGGGAGIAAEAAVVAVTLGNGRSLAQPAP